MLWGNPTATPLFRPLTCVRRATRFPLINQCITQPYEDQQDKKWAYEKAQLDKIRAGDFKPGGKGHRADSFRLKLRQHELKSELFTQLRKDQPSFLKVLVALSDRRSPVALLAVCTCIAPVDSISSLARQSRDADRQ